MYLWDWVILIIDSIQTRTELTMSSKNDGEVLKAFRTLLFEVEEMYEDARRSPNATIPRNISARSR